MKVIDAPSGLDGWGALDEVKMARQVLTRGRVLKTIDSFKQGVPIMRRAARGALQESKRFDNDLRKWVVFAKRLGLK